MKRLAALLVAGAFALAGCSKKDEDKKTDPKADPKGETAAKVAHGEKQGKGDGGGDKAAAGKKDGTKGSAPEKAASPVERGAYVAGLGGCAICHTQMDWKTMQPVMDKAFAGGFTMKEEFGEWTSPNITPDPETGIGKWTDEQIMAAFRDGVRPDGSKLHPIMPWPFYNNMTDDDAKAVVAFLRAQKPVVNKVERNKLPPMELPLPPAQRVDPKDDPVGHGAYLAGLMHCVMCHTPMTEKGPDFSKAFSGGMEFKMPPEMAGMVEGELFASNITSDPETGIGKWSEADVVTALTKMVRPDGRPILGPMMTYAAFWSQLTPEDASAIAKFVKAIPPVKNKVVSTMKMKGPPPGAGPGAPPAPAK
jgi:mono/diheme cytochrome c family protein